MYKSNQEAWPALGIILRQLGPTCAKYGVETPLGEEAARARQPLAVIGCPVADRTARKPVTFRSRLQEGTGENGVGMAIARERSSIHSPLPSKEEAMQTLRSMREIAIPVAIVLCYIAPFLVPLG